MGHDPQNEVDFEGRGWCRFCRRSFNDVLFYACTCCSGAVGHCPICGEDIDRDGPEPRIGSPERLQSAVRQSQARYARQREALRPVGAA